MIKRLIPLLLLVCLLLGCSQPQVPATEPVTEPPQVEAETVAPETEAPPVYVPEDIPLQAVNAHGFRKTRETPTVVILDHRTAAFLTATYSGGDYSRKSTRIQVVDLHADFQICETELEGTYTPLTQCAAEGYLALAAPDGEVVVLDRNLRQVLTFQTQDGKGVLSKDLGKYYCIWSSGLSCMDVKTGESHPVETGTELVFSEILGYDAEENLALVSAYAGTFASELCLTAVDLDTGELRLLYDDITGGALAEGGVLLQKERTEDRCADVFYGDWSDASVLQLPGFLVNDLDYAAWHIAGSDYVCRFTYDAMQKTDIVEFQLFHLGGTIRVASLQSLLKGARITRMIALPDGNLLAMESNSRGFRTYLIVPKQLTFTDAVVETAESTAMVDDTALNGDDQSINWEIPEKLTQVRQRADSLEEKYGITILLSGQCTDALKASNMTIVTTDQAFLRDEAGAIDDALDQLDAMFSRYPDDFFRQFRDEAGQWGLLVLLVEDFVDDLNIIGLSYGMGRWYPIAVDITSGEVGNTFCHEVWHATENRINDLNAVALDLDAWENCNPAGYRYSGNMTPSYIEDTQYTYIAGAAGDPVHFVDPYAKVNSKEDRARLMEYVMYTEQDARMMLEHPAMEAKLRILCDAIRRAFDTQHWEAVHWERFF